jgi:hypothetical protein
MGLYYPNFSEKEIDKLKVGFLKALLLIFDKLKRLLLMNYVIKS